MPMLLLPDKIYADKRSIILNYQAKNAMITTNLITEKAIELFSLYGIRGITVNDIADGLGISKKTINSFFINKTAVVEAVIDEMVSKNQAGCLLIKKQSDHAISEMYLLINYLEKFYNNLSRTMIDDLKFAYPNAAEKLKNYKSGFLLKQIKANLHAGMEENLYRNDLNVDISASFILQNILFIYRVGQETEGFSAKNEVVGQIIFGLVSAKGAVRIQQFRHIQHIIKHERKDCNPLWDH